MDASEPSCAVVCAPAARDAKQAGAFAIALFLLSFSTTLFTLAVFKLLTFFVMPSLFFDLLFVGFPIGALLGARFFTSADSAFARSLWILKSVMLVSVGACFSAKWLDYLRAHLFDIELSRLLGQVATFVVLFLPFFASYGLSEYLGYQAGRRRLGGRMRTVYALALFGAAAAYVTLKTALPSLGMARLLIVAFLGIALTVLAASGPVGRKVASLEIVGLTAAFFVPGIEETFLDLYKGRGIQSTWDYKTRLHCRPVFQRWGRYSLCEILAEPGGRAFHGFYNDMFQWEHSPELGFRNPSLGAIPILRTRPGDSIAVVGAGGGRQVRLADRLGGRSIVAIELEPAVFEAVRGPQHLLRAFRHVYESPRVTPVRAEARGYLERSTQKFDLIYLPSVGGYAQMMIEPGNMVRTFEAHRMMRDHLTERGVLAIWYPRGLDHREILTRQYVRTLRALGMKAEAYRNDVEFLILGFRSPRAEVPSAEQLAGDLPVPAEFARLESFRPRRLETGADPRFTSVTDDKPYLAGNVRYILKIGQVYQLFALAIVLVAGVGIGAWLMLRRGGDPEVPGRPLGSVALLALLIGANFLMAEHFLVLALFRSLFVYEDALGLGAVAFLTLSGLGSLIASRSLRPALVLAGLLGLLILVTRPGWFSTVGIVLAFAPIGLAAGTFFPALFDEAARKPVTVFAFDAVGAGLGASAATFIPILWGFRTYFAIAILFFAATAVADMWFHGRFASMGSERTSERA